MAARCNVDLQTYKSGLTALQLAEREGHAGIATLIRNKKHKGADRGQKDSRLLQASPEEIKKQLEDAQSKPRLLHGQVLNSLWKAPLHLGVRDGRVGFPDPQSSIRWTAIKNENFQSQLLLFLFVAIVLITRRCCLSRQLAYADVCYVC
jgi:hypothetical protein